MIRELQKIIIRHKIAKKEKKEKKKEKEKTSSKKWMRGLKLRQKDEKKSEVILIGEEIWTSWSFSLLRRMDEVEAAILGFKAGAC